MWILSSSNWAQVTEHLRPGKTSGGTPEPEPKKPHFYYGDDKSVSTARTAPDPVSTLLRSGGRGGDLEERPA